MAISPKITSRCEGFNRVAIYAPPITPGTVTAIRNIPNFISTRSCFKKATELEPIPAACMSREDNTAFSGDIFNAIRKNGIHKIPPPMPMADAKEAIRMPAGNAVQWSRFMVFYGIKIKILNNLAQTFAFGFQTLNFRLNICFIRM